ACLLKPCFYPVHSVCSFSLSKLAFYWISLTGSYTNGRCPWSSQWLSHQDYTEFFELLPVRPVTINFVCQHFFGIIATPDFILFNCFKQPGTFIECFP